MRSLSIVAHPPLLDKLSSFLERSEPFLIQAFISEATIEGLDQAVLRRFAGLNEVQLHPVLGRPEIQCLAAKLRAIVDLDELWLAAMSHHFLQHPHHALAAQRGVGLNSQTLPSEGIDQVQGAKGTSITQNISEHH